jgi:hypothetical protein
MSIANVIDKRTNSYKTDGLYIVLEPSCNDNSNPSATEKFDDVYDMPNAFTVREFFDATILEVVIDAAQYNFPITMFIYESDETE